jgi:hypothetical protein
LRDMTWTVDAAPRFVNWLLGLPSDLHDAVLAAVEVLEERGPAVDDVIVFHVPDMPHWREVRLRGGVVVLQLGIDPQTEAMLLMDGEVRPRYRSWKETQSAIEVIFPIRNDRLQ